MRLVLGERTRRVDDRVEVREPVLVEQIVFRERGPLDRNYYNRHVWKPPLVKADVEPTRENGMHGLRHHYASVLLDGGVSIRALAAYLGHTDPGFTLRTYTHLMPDSEDRARSVVDAALGPRVAQVLPETAD